MDAVVQLEPTRGYISTKCCVHTKIDVYIYRACIHAARIFYLKNESLNTHKCILDMLVYVWTNNVAAWKISESLLIQTFVLFSFRMKDVKMWSVSSATTTV